MKAAAFFRLGKLSGGKGHVLVAGRHNKRETQGEQGATSRIDVTRSHLNYCVRGEATAQAVANKAQQLMAAAGIDKLRKDAVRAIELLFSLPRSTAIDTYSYFDDCVAWAAQRFGDENILTADTHLDEGAPHCHVLVLPLRNGRMVGSALVGGRAALKATVDDFHANVASRYGLPRGGSRLRSGQKQLLAQTVTKRLSAISDPATESSVWPQLREAIESDPEPFALALNIQVEPSPTKTKPDKAFVEIMTGTGRRTAEDRKKPIGFRGQKPTEHRLVPFAPSPSSVPTPAPIERVASEAQFVETQRVRDSDFPADMWDVGTGEFIVVAEQAQPQRQSAEKWVSEQLTKRRASSLGNTDKLSRGGNAPVSKRDESCER